MNTRIIKIAALTLRRAGLITMLFFSISFYLIFPVCTFCIELLALKSKPLEITATMTGPINLSQLNKIDGIIKVSPVVRESGQAYFENYKLQAEIKGVLSSYLDKDNISGAVFRDSSAMPYLVINSAAIRSFVNEDGDKADGITLGSQIRLQLNNETSAILCGILEDDSEEPAIYMSYTLARELKEEIGDAELCVLTENAGSIRKVTRELKRYYLEVTTDIEKYDEEWRDKQMLLWQYVLCSLGFLICATSMSYNNVLLEQLMHSDERKSLRLAGLPEKSLSLIVVLRQALVQFFSAMIACIISWWANIFSFFALLCVVVLAVIISLFIGCVDVRIVNRLCR